MPTFNPFSSVTGRNSYSLFDIRLDQDFIVFRGNDHESAGQLLKGVVVLCLSQPLRIEDIHLRLTGTHRVSWADPRSSTPAVAGQKVDKTTLILDHRWAPFVGTHGKSMTLPAGNYEYPFDFTLPGDTSESVEGIPEASITYRLKATVSRSKLAYDLHAYKHLRIIRTLEAGALEFLHAMSVENIWPNKLEYSVVIPQKAVVFGGVVDMEMRFTPLLKGLELGEVTAKMIETRECVIQGSTGINIREHKTERDVATWKFQVTREDHWHDMIEETGQEGWALTKQLSLPKKLRQCIQDLNHHGIKVRHKIKLTVALKNPDGHISELRATLPVSIFISPNIPFNEQGDMVNQAPGEAGVRQQSAGAAPPGYGEHILDQLYEDMDTSGFQTPALQSGVSSPFYAQSRSGSAENLHLIGGYMSPIAPAALSSRLADVSLDPSQRSTSYYSLNSLSGRVSPNHGTGTGTGNGSAARSEPPSNNLTRSNSEEDGSDRASTEHVHLDPEEFAELNRVPSYATAVRTPARSRVQTPGGPLPDYQTALSAPRTPPVSDGVHEILSPITERTTEEYNMQRPEMSRNASVINGRVPLSA
ncbi:HECT-type ubiquitin ligase-interacting protein creD [Beauveria bassiana D1-5]|uniref:HECT-type ubiquitin ligase-interacting protein creD n=1 Tax=Beauveria bassiana D1-5 TaxID=1245745 RepID=A0A0A2VSJ3_BEABA|nr:HECT-type ubiquitin ligase-interacting protein creD [Beauveria bassiana D1-5]